jgi:hypothetical protein
MNPIKKLKPVRLTWEQCEERGFHVWKVIDPRLPMVCKTCSVDAVETARRRRAAGHREVR